MICSIPDSLIATASGPPPQAAETSRPSFRASATFPNLASRFTIEC